MKRRWLPTPVKIEELSSIEIDSIQTYLSKYGSEDFVPVDPIDFTGLFEPVSPFAHGIKSLSGRGLVAIVFSVEGTFICLSPDARDLFEKVQHHEQHIKN